MAATTSTTTAREITRLTGFAARLERELREARRIGHPRDMSVLTFQLQRTCARLNALGVETAA